MTDKKQRAFTIAAAKPSNAGALARLHFRAYADRFFSKDARDRDGKPYGAPLAADFPQLEKGQNEAYFRTYWKSFVRKLGEPEARQRNYCFVAWAGRRPLAFIKGDGLPVTTDLQMRGALRAAFIDAAGCCELGSVYCDPREKYAGLGRALTARFAACAQDLGYDGMITRAYARNDSPAFFERLGARRMGTCDIPNQYLTEEGALETAVIPGVWLYWDGPALAALARTARP